MKNRIKIIILIGVIGQLIYSFLGIKNGLDQKQKIEQSKPYLKLVGVIDIDGKKIIRATFNHHPIVLIYFDPDCEHCQREADELHKKAALLTEAKIILLSSAPASALKTFAITHKLDQLSNIQIAHIDRKEAYETFGFASVPDVLIYHTDGSLAKRFKGETSMEAIARQL